MKVADWLKMYPRQALTVDENWSLSTVLEKVLATSCIGDIYVIDKQGHIKGHLALKKLARLVLAEYQPIQTRSQILERVTAGCATELMEVHFVIAQPNEDLQDVLHRQLDHWVEDLPVVDDMGKLLGVINMRDLLIYKIKNLG